jgi:hypothetical protein
MKLRIAAFLFLIDVHGLAAAEGAIRILALCASLSRRQRPRPISLMMVSAHVDGLVLSSTEQAVDVHVLGRWCVSLSAWHFWHSSEGTEGVAADALRRGHEKRLEARFLPANAHDVAFWPLIIDISKEPAVVRSQGLIADRCRPLTRSRHPARTSDDLCFDPHQSLARIPLPPCSPWRGTTGCIHCPLQSRWLWRSAQSASCCSRCEAELPWVCCAENRHACRQGRPRGGSMNSNRA